MVEKLQGAGPWQTLPCIELAVLVDNWRTATYLGIGQTLRAGQFNPIAFYEQGLCSVKVPCQGGQVVEWHTFPLRGKRGNFAAVRQRHAVGRLHSNRNAALLVDPRQHVDLM